MSLNVLNDSEHKDVVTKDPWCDPNKEVIKVCHGFTCGSREARPILQNLKDHFKNVDDIQVVACPCTGNCKKSNNVVVNTDIMHWQQSNRVVQAVENKLREQRMTKARTEGPISADEAEDILGL